MPKENNVILTFDLGKETEIKKILVIPRNDDNFIELGDCYELFYQNGPDGWKSLESSARDFLRYIITFFSFISIIYFPK